MHTGILKLAVVLWSLILSAQAGAQIPVRNNWTAVTGAQSGMFMAQHEGLFKKNGLDIELIHIPSSSRGIQAILAGEIAFSFMDGSCGRGVPGGEWWPGGW
jgi:ABC-type nitrate/sulfonate/bicarbonate transport system substrate-binding protein